MIYGIPKTPHIRERRTTILLLFLYAVIAAALFYNERYRENVAENNARNVKQSAGLKNSTSPS